jgi:hypothetical protein
VLTAFIIKAMMKKAASTSETSLNINQTTRLKIRENRDHHTRRRENLKTPESFSKLISLTQKTTLA